MMKRLKISTILTAITLCCSMHASELQKTTAVPFLQFAPDARSGGMGDIGVATSADLASHFWNPAKYQFAESDGGVGLSYTPWLREITEQINLAYLSGYQKIDQVQGVSGSLRYFSYGEIELTDNVGTVMGSSSPNEFSFDLGYNRKLSDQLSGAVVLRYIRSAIFEGAVAGYEAGNAFAADLSFFYSQNLMLSNAGIFSAGINVQNIGSKISYNGGETKNSLPTTLILGANYSSTFDHNVSYGLSTQYSNLLVELADSEYSDNYSISLGGEVEFNNLVNIRIGYKNENRNIVKQNYTTFGAGLNWDNYTFDYAYIIPVNNSQSVSSSMRFSISYKIK